MCARRVSLPLKQWHGGSGIANAFSYAFARLISPRTMGVHCAMKWLIRPAAKFSAVARALRILQGIIHHRNKFKINYVGKRAAGFPCDTSFSRQYTSRKKIFVKRKDFS